MKGILLVNTGSPISKTRRDVRSFIASMLMDPLVMTVPDWFRPILVKGIILPFRQFKSSKRYSLIWDDVRDVPPLLYHMKQLQMKLERKTELPVEIAMRYKEPSIRTAFERFDERGVTLTEIVVLPMFPHYAESSYETVVQRVKERYAEAKRNYSLHIVEPYFSNEGYIKSLANSIKPYLEEEFDKLVFSYHSLPLSHIEKAMAKGRGFDYIYQTKETTKLVCGELGIDSNKVRQAYSSAMGSKWLEPSLGNLMSDLGKEKMKRVLVVSAGFAVDNLETLFDIGIEASARFKKAGGGKLEVIPCLNSSKEWIDAVAKITS